MGGLLPVLTFHSLDDRTSPISFPAPLLREAMARLHERGFGTLTPWQRSIVCGEGQPTRYGSATECVPGSS